MKIAHIQGVRNAAKNAFTHLPQQRPLRSGQNPLTCGHCPRDSEQKMWTRMDMFSLHPATSQNIDICIVSMLQSLEKCKTVKQAVWHILRLNMIYGVKFFFMTNIVMILPHKVIASGNNGFTPLGIIIMFKCKIDKNPWQQYSVLICQT